MSSRDVIVRMRRSLPRAGISGCVVVSAYRRKVYELIRTELLISAIQERRVASFNLYGRGHEARVTVNVRLAGVLRGTKLPSVYLPGYGPKTHYPLRVFKRADKALARALGKSPFSWYFQVVGLGVVNPPHIHSARVISLSDKQTPGELNRRGWIPTPDGLAKNFGRVTALLSESADEKPARHWSISFSPIADLDEVIRRRKTDLERLKR